MPPESHVTSDSDLESVLSLKEVKTKSSSRRNSVEPKYSCSIAGCEEQFKRLDHLDRHEYHHTGIRKHACTYDGCTKTYSILTHLKRHLRTTHERTASPKKNIACLVESCDKMFPSVCNMQRHIREVHENPKIYYCVYCGEKFKQKMKMRRHEIAKHTGDYPYNCSKCSKGFHQEWQYERHVPACKVYPCSNCDALFDKWTLYLKHCKETQHGRKYYKCEHCPRYYAKPSQLQQHTAANHLSEEQKMNFKCPNDGCDRTYTYERNLRQHILTVHSGKRFECKEELCKRSFCSAQNLTKHVERDHKSQKSAGKQKRSSKTLRKTRKTAGQPIMSHLAKLSGLAVEKDLDKGLRARETDALDTVVLALSQETAMNDLREGSETPNSFIIDENQSDEPEGSCQREIPMQDY